MALKAEILAQRSKRKVSKPITVPGWDQLTESLHFRTLTAEDVDRLESVVSQKNMEHFRGTYVRLLLCDDKGYCIFSDDDVEMLDQMPAGPINWIIEQGKAWNGIADNEDLEGKSEADPAGGCGGE